MYNRILPYYDEILKREREMWKSLSLYRRYWVLVFFLILEALIVIYYALHSEYGFEQDENQDIIGVRVISNERVQTYYPLFQDILVMVFIGFGFIYSALKYYQWSAIAFNFVMGAFSIQFGIIAIHFWEMVFTGTWNKLRLDIAFLIRGTSVAAAVLISYGTVIGKYNLGQYLFMTFLEVIFMTLNQVIGEYVLRAIDMGGSMYVHVFGAFFGLSMVMAYQFMGTLNHEQKVLGYYSSVFSFIGTLFFFMYWPSGNAALAILNGKERIIINTHFTMLASVMSTFLFTPLWTRGKLNIFNVLNATISGGVASGACAGLMRNVYISLLIGLFTGAMSSFAYSFLSNKLEAKISVQETYGVFSLHGLSGIIGALINPLLIVTMSRQRFQELVGEYFDFIDRSNAVQAALQIAALGATLVISIITGFISGKILKLPCFNEIEYLYTDVVNWNYPRKHDDEADEANVLDFELPDNEVFVHHQLPLILRYIKNLKFFDFYIQYYNIIFNKSQIYITQSECFFTYLILQFPKKSNFIYYI